jgi:hypothetical protein
MKWWAKPGVVAVALLSACASLSERVGEQEITGLLRSLKEADQRHEVGTVEGYLYLMRPALPTPLMDWPVTLIPLPPTLEAHLIRMRQQFDANGRVALSPAALARARQPITDYLADLTAPGRSDLIRQVKTDPKGEPQFRFHDVPQGRWLLLAKLPSPLSVQLWAQPVTVRSGEQTWHSLHDNNLWLEGLIR